MKDWLSDPELQCVSASSRGMWIDALCYMWEAPERGKLAGTPEEMAKLLRATNGDFTQFMNDVKRHKFATVTIRDNEVTLINRRMFREQKSKENHALRQDKYRVRQKSDNEVTPPSPSPSPSPSPKKKELYSSFFLSFWEQYPKKVGKPNAFKEWNRIKPDLETVLSSLNAQIESKERLLAENKFCPEWPDPERWIKNQRWLDEIQDAVPLDATDRMIYEMKKEREKDGHTESS